MSVPGCRARSRRTLGFTFVELIAVIAIIGLLAAIVVANLDRFSVYARLNSAARALGNQLLQVRDIAATHHRPLHVDLDQEHQRWRVVGPPSPHAVPAEKEREEQTIYGGWNELDDGVRIDEIAFGSGDAQRSGVFRVTFEGDGEVVPSGFVVYFVHEQLPDDEGVSVEVSGLTALVAYHQGRIRPEEVRDADDF